MVVTMNVQAWLDQARKQIAQFFGMAAVTPVPVGRPHDGLTLHPSGTPIDKPWHELSQEFADARTAWRNNPLARRLIGLISAYVVGNGITLTSNKRDLSRFLQQFWAHNRLDLRIDEWCDELARSGELFPVLFTNPVTGISTVRAVPPSLIRTIDFDPDDYERERRYMEVSVPGHEKWWTGLAGEQAADPATPLMLHYAVNRPVGAVRGESDLAPILPWLRRYNRWLEDRVRLNAALRAFLWVVHAPARLRTTLEERYRTPPEPGSLIIAEEDAETWQALTPQIGATDAAADGRALRWMIVAGGPGTALLDIGEGEDANLATGQAMAEQRRRFLRRRQAYLVYLLTDLSLHAYARYRLVLPTKSKVSWADITAITPDISPEDNASLATAARALTGSIEGMARILGNGPAFRTLALRLFIKFIGESIGEPEAQAILLEREAENPRPEGRSGGGGEER
jgi:hypothetical protein